MMCNKQCLAFDDNFTEQQKEDNFVCYCKTKKKLIKYKETCLYYSDTSLIGKLNDKDILMISKEIYNIINLFHEDKIDNSGYNYYIDDSINKLRNILLVDKYKVKEK